MCNVCNTVLKSLEPIDAIWRQGSRSTSAKVMACDGNKPLPEPMLTYHQFCPVTFKHIRTYYSFINSINSYVYFEIQCDVYRWQIIPMLSESFFKFEFQVQVLNGLFGITISLGDTHIKSTIQIYFENPCTIYFSKLVLFPSDDIF